MGVFPSCKWDLGNVRWRVFPATGRALSKDVPPANLAQSSYAGPFSGQRATTLLASPGHPSWINLKGSPSLLMWSVLTLGFDRNSVGSRGSQCFNLPGMTNFHHGKPLIAWKNPCIFPVASSSSVTFHPISAGFEGLRLQSPFGR